MGNSHAFFVERGAFATTFTGFCVFSVIMAGESNGGTGKKCYLSVEC